MGQPSESQPIPSLRSPRILWRLALGVPLLAIALGLATDACTGFAMLRGAGSYGRALALIVGLGALYLVGEALGDAIASRDRVSHPLSRRALHLGALLAALGALSLAVWLLYAWLT